MIQYRKVQAKDLESIAKIHLKSLPNDFCSLLGLKFLQKLFYPTIYQDSQSEGWVATDEQNNVIGFVFFSANHSFFGDLVKGNFGVFLRLLLANGWKPQFLLYCLTVLGLMLRSKFPTHRSAELAYIAVDRDAQGKGIGYALVKCGMSGLATRKLQTVWVKTLATTPGTVNFYQKLGFKTYHNLLGRTFLQATLADSTL